MKLFRFDRYLFLMNVISIMVAFLTHFPELIALLDPDSEQTLFPDMHPVDVVNEVIFTYLSLVLLFGLNTWLFKFNRDSVSIRFPQVVCSLVITWMGSNLLGQGYVGLHHWLSIPAIDASLHHYLHPLRDGLISIIVTGSCYLMYLNRKSRRMLVENQMLRTVNLVNQYESLKSQLNPHMLFNSLNTLNSLIRETPGKAQDYLQELSKVLRYSLQESDSHRVTLEEEMNFVRSYMYLLQMRFEENLVFEVEVAPEALSKTLPPVSVQLLVENAVKHNEISNRHPLHIRIRADKDALSVSNPIQPKLTASSGTHIGLSNLSKRYQLLFGREIEVKEEKNHFIVILPLI